MAATDRIFKAYDIRGTFPEEIDAPLCRAIGSAFARFVAAGPAGTAPAGTVLVARDMRESGVELAAAFTDGVLDQGLDVVDLGLASTDLVYYAAGALDAPAAMFTASHNPAQYNGIKLCLAGAAPVGEESGLAEIQAMVDGPPAAPAPAPGTRREREVLADYVAHAHSFIDVGALRPLKVIADVANGMGGLVVPAAFAGLPIDLEVMFPELDGTFPNHPADPIQIENLAALRARVVETGADVGLAFDGDADRVFLVDERGEPVSGSLTTTLIAIGVLEKHPGETIIHNLICSKALPEIVREHGGTPVRTRVGHSFIKAVMAETGAAFGGEHSAHYYFRDNYRADSGLIASLIVLERLSRSDEPLSSILAPLQRYAGSGEINTRVADPQGAIDRVAAAYADHPQDRLDGLTVELEDWWFNLRPSNTEPLLRLNLEAATPEACDAHVAEVRSLLTEA